MSLKKMLLMSSPNTSWERSSCLYKTPKNAAKKPWEFGSTKPGTARNRAYEISVVEVHLGRDLMIPPLSRLWRKKISWRTFLAAPKANDFKACWKIQRLQGDFRRLI